MLALDRGVIENKRVSSMVDRTDVGYWIAVRHIQVYNDNGSEE